MKSLCPYPFARMEFNPSKEFIPCCANWLKEEFFELEVGVDPWNGPAAQALRKSILDGNYCFCKTEQCHPRMVDPSVEDYETVFEAPISAVNRKAILEGRTQMPGGPTSYSVVNDPRCNLACPSCRKEHIKSVDVERERGFQETDALIEKYRATLEVLKLSGDGEVFFSPWLKSLVKRIDPERFPRFRHIYILSNGLLLNEKMYQSLMPGAAFIKQVSISVDAGNEETYKQVRGGAWSKLLKNLFWIGEQRKKKVIPYFQLNFTLRLDNFRSLPEFIALAKKVNASNAKVTAFYDYPSSAIHDYGKQAVHLPENPYHSELRQIWETCVAQDPFVRWSLPEPVG